MAKIYADNETGRLFTVVNNQRVDLIDGETQLEGPDGGTYVWSAAAGRMIPQAGMLDNIAKSANNAIKAFSTELMTAGLIEPESNFNIQKEGVLPERVTMPNPELTRAIKSANEKESGVAKGLSFAKDIALNPIDIGLPMLTESLVPMAVQAGAGFAGGALGGALTGPAAPAGVIGGFMAGTGLGSAAMNFGPVKEEVIQRLAAETGTDISNADAYAAFINTPVGINGETVAQIANNEAIKKAGVVAPADMMSAGIAGRMALAAKKALEAGELTAKKVAKDVAIGTGISMGLAGAGEAGGQTLQRGSVEDPLAVAAEVMLEPFGTAFDAIAAYKALGLQTNQKDVVDTEEELADIERYRAEDAEGDKILPADYDGLTQEDRLRAQEYLTNNTPDRGASVTPEMFKRVALILRRNALKDEVNNYLTGLAPIKAIEFNQDPKASLQSKRLTDAITQAQKEAETNVAKHPEYQEWLRSPAYKKLPDTQKRNTELALKKKLATDYLRTVTSQLNEQAMENGEVSMQDTASLFVDKEGNISTSESFTKQLETVAENKQKELQALKLKKQQYLDSGVELSQREQLTAANNAARAGFTQPMRRVDQLFGDKKFPIASKASRPPSVFAYKNPNTGETITAVQALGQDNSSAIKAVNEAINRLEFSDIPAIKKAIADQQTQVLDALTPKVRKGLEVPPIVPSTQGSTKGRKGKKATAPVLGVTDGAASGKAGKKVPAPVPDKFKWLVDTVSQQPTTSNVDVGTTPSTNQVKQPVTQTPVYAPIDIKQEVAEARKTLKEEVDKVEKAAEATPSVRGAVIRSLSVYNRWLGDIDRIAALTGPNVRSFASVMRQRDIQRSTLQEQMLNNLVVPILNLKDKAAIGRVSKAAAILDINKTTLGPIDTTKPYTVTANRDYPGFVKEGDSVTLKPTELKVLAELEQSMRKYGLEHLQATSEPLIDEVLLSNLEDVSEQSLGELQFEKKLELLKQLNDALVQTEPKSQAAKAARNEVINTYNWYQERYKAISQKFYLSHIRDSINTPYFLPITLTNVPRTNEDGSVVVDKDGNPKMGVKYVEQVPSTFFSRIFKKGNRVRGAKYDAFLKKVTDRLKAQGYEFTIGEPYNVLANEGLFMRDDQIDLMERLALVSQFGKEGEKKALLSAIKTEFGKQQFDKHWLRRKDVPGWITDTNEATYTIGANIFYSNSTSKTIVNNKTRGALNKSLAAIAKDVKEDRLDKNVLDYVNELYDYSTSPSTEMTTLRSMMFTYFLGRISSGLLQLIQPIHSTLPVLTAISGKPAASLIDLAKVTGKANRFISYLSLGDDVLVTSSGRKGADEDLFQKMKAAHFIKPQLSDELSAKEASRAILGNVDGVSPLDSSRFKEFVNKTNNVLGYLFSRSEAFNRLVSAFATVEVLDKVSSDPTVRQAAIEYFKQTAYAEELVPILQRADKTEMTSTDTRFKFAEAVVRLTQFDATKLGRAKAFRGPFMSVAGQFLGFPIKMNNLYLDLLRGAGGIKGVLTNPNDPISKAFVVMALGLFLTSGMFGALPYGYLTKDITEKLIGYITGVAPDFEREIAELVVDATGSELGQEILLHGVSRSLLGVDISKRVGINAFDTLSLETNVFDILGPTGGFIQNLARARELQEQGHPLLAYSMTLPMFFQDLAKAYYAEDYGLVTQSGQLTPEKMTTADLVKMGMGFTPTSLAQTREVKWKQESLSKKAAIRRERITDKLTTLRTKSEMARLRGNEAEAQKYMAAYYKQIEEVNKYNSKIKRASEKVEINPKTIQRRVNENLQAKQGITSDRRIPVRLREEAESLENIFESGYLE